MTTDNLVKHGFPSTIDTYQMQDTMEFFPFSSITPVKKDWVKVVNTNAELHSHSS